MFALDQVSGRVLLTQLFIFIIFIVSASRDCSTNHVLTRVKRLISLGAEAILWSNLKLKSQAPANHLPFALCEKTVGTAGLGRSMLGLTI